MDADGMRHAVSAQNIGTHLTAVFSSHRTQLASLQSASCFVYLPKEWELHSDAAKAGHVGRRAYERRNRQLNASMSLQHFRCIGVRL